MMSPEQRLRALEELEQRQQHNQRRVARAVWASIVGGTLVLGGVVAVASWQLRSLNQHKGELQRDIEKLNVQKQQAEREIRELDQQRKAATGALSNLPEAELKKAIDRQFAAAPKTAALLPRIYMQIVDKSDMARAGAIRKALQDAGYIVLGIEYVPQAQGLKVTDVRFYHAAEKAEAEKIQQAMTSAGESDVRLNHLKQYENSTKARPNHFEVWLAHRAE